MSEAEHASTTSLCPKCAYDRRTQAVGAPCSECGYIIPAGARIVFIPRVAKNVASQIAWTIVVVVLAVSLLGSRLFMSNPFFLALIGMGIVSIAIRQFRIWWSEDAFVGQFWATTEGFGYVRDIDRYSFARSIEWFLNSLLFCVFVVVFFVSNGTKDPIPFLLPFALVAVLRIIPFRPLGVRRIRSPDDTIPPLTPWNAIRALRFSHSDQNVISIGRRFHSSLANFCAPTMQISGDERAYQEITEAVHQMAPTTLALEIERKFAK